MTRKDYRIIAKALADARDRGDNDVAAVENVAYWIADALSSDNYRFDQDRFLAAVRNGHD